MKIILKNLKQVIYNVEIPSEKSTVLELKKEIEKTHKFEATKLKLLFNGVLLDDSKTLGDYKIQEDSVVIMMNSKVKPINVGGTSSNTTSSQPKTEEKKEKKIEKKQEIPKKEEKKYTEQVKSLIDMGFEKSQAESAIKAAKGQIDKAIDFLYNGIPEGLKDNDSGQGAEQQNQEQSQEQGEGANQQEEDEDPVKTVASVAKILCKNNPSTLSILLQNIQHSDPDLMNLIKQHEEEFKNYLEEPINEQDYRAFQNYQQKIGLGGLGLGQGGASGPRPVRLNLTPQDREAINRLKALGDFDEAEVIQAYIACDKNEELTANYLFEQKMNGNGQ